MSLQLYHASITTLWWISLREDRIPTRIIFPTAPRSLADEMAVSASLSLSLFTSRLSCFDLYNSENFVQYYYTFEANIIQQSQPDY